MQSTVVALLGASGKTGRAVQSALAGGSCGAGQVSVRPLGRDLWADPVAALAGCDAAYLLAPNLHPDEPGLVRAALEAAGRAGVGRVVYHSVAAPYAPAMPHHLGKAVAEDLVRRSGLEWTILQPCAYVQNFLPALTGDWPALTVPYDVDRLFGLVDLADVGEAAATVLLEAGHHGATYELGGPALVSVRDVAEVAATVLDRPVAATRTDPQDWRGGMLDAREQEWLRAMFAYYDAYGLPTGAGPVTGLLGRTATTLEATLRRELAR